MLFPSIVQLSIHNHIEKTLQHIEKTLLMPTHNALHLSCFDPFLSVALISERLELLLCSLEPFSRNCEFKVSRRLSDSDRPDSTLSTLALRCVPCPVRLLTAASRRGLDVQTETCENTCCSSDDCTLHMCRTADT